MRPYSVWVLTEVWYNYCLVSGKEGRGGFRIIYFYGFGETKWMYLYYRPRSSRKRKYATSYCCCVILVLTAAVSCSEIEKRKKKQDENKQKSRTVTLYQVLFYSMRRSSSSIVLHVCHDGFWPEFKCNFWIATQERYTTRYLAYYFSKIKV